MRTVTTWGDLLYPGSATSFFDRDPLPAFDPNGALYSAANAWWLAELSRLVYRHDVEEGGSPPRPFRSSFLRKAGLRQLRFFNSATVGTQALLVRADGETSFAALVFRGTEQNLTDYLCDLDCRKVRHGGAAGLVHRGFMRALDGVWKEISEELDRLDCPVFYAGHSLGAALATLAASLRPPRAAYTFGSPLVGNEGFVSTLKEVPVFRVVHGCDAVTTMPPEAFGFRHAGDLRRIMAPPTASPRILSNVFRRLARPPKPLGDHAAINYVERIDLSDTTLRRGSDR